jgi:hypothetical protein
VISPVRRHGRIPAKRHSAKNGTAATGISKQTITEQAIITPSCGTGSMAEADAEKVFEMVKQVSAAMKKKYGF